MPHSSDDRFENCPLPPKKLACRSINISRTSKRNLTSSQETEIVSQDISKMEFLPVIKRQSSPPARPPPNIEPMSPIRLMSNISQPRDEDAPLEFSMNPDNPSYRSNRDLLSCFPMPNGSFQQFMSYTEYLKRIQMYQSAFPDKSNGITSPSKNIGMRWNMDKSPIRNHHDSQPNYKNQNNSKRACTENNSEWGVKRSAKIRMSGETMTYKKSPEHLRFSKENRPANESSILQQMLESHDNTPVTSKMQDIHISAPESFQHGNFMNISSPMLSPVNQSTTSSLLSPVNGYMSLTVAPMSFCPSMGYGISPVGNFPGSMLTPGSNAFTLQSAMTRRQKKKRIHDSSFKSYPMEVLQEKLQSVSGNSFAFGLDYSQQTVAESLVSKKPAGDLCISDSNKKEENSEIVSSAINSNNSSTTSGITNSPNAQNGSGGSNDSTPSASPEGDESRKRKTTDDTEKNDAYWERRKKNNLSARRSRRARREKEDFIANRALHLSTINDELTRKLTEMNFTYADIMSNYSILRQDCETLKIQNNVLQERLFQKRCEQCGAELPNGISLN